MRSTKIIATLGPATSTPEQIAAVVRAGADLVRLNFSHGSQEEHAERVSVVRRVAEESGRAVAILQDLQGPKIRTGALAQGAPVELETGATFRIGVADLPGDETRVSTSYAALPTDARPGDRILLSDGLIELRVETTSETEIVTTVVHGGVLNERQGINLPGVAVSADSITQKDIEDLAFGLDQGVDFVALSFVRSATDVLRVKELVAKADQDTPVIAKLEKPEALEALPAIVEASDGIMVARGDLGVELSPEKVPLVQKRIIEAANRRARPVITATQMLESMIHNTRPTRAEASDVANAILDGSDAIMLSGETAVGKHPARAVETMVRVAEEVHRSHRERWGQAPGSWEANAVTSEPEAIGAAVAATVRSLADVKAIWVLTQSGETARLVSHCRPGVPILAFTPEPRTFRRLALFWGVTPVEAPPARTLEELEGHLVPLVLSRGLAREGDTVVVTGSHPFDVRAATNFLKIQKVRVASSS